MKLSVVMPVYNEAGTIEDILAAVRAVPIEKEIVLVDDFSTDGTREKLAELAKTAGSDNIRVVLHERNCGKGAALRTGYAYATGDIVIVQDADLEYDPRDYPRLIEPILAGRADVVYGTRFPRGHTAGRAWHAAGNKVLTLLSNLCTGLHLSDMETCYKVFRREIIRGIEIEEDRFGVEPEVTAKIAALGVRIAEVPIAYAGRTYEQGKKIGWRDGLRALWCILKYNLRR
jgi:glycosyltransferase involved in cell wall biosynthesis